ncbi:MAG: HEPN domain-containing protein [Hydrogenobacter sp.]
MFNWGDFIKFSEELLTKKPQKYEEALYRTIISRAYYGVFKQVEDFFKNNKLEELLDKSATGSHQRIIEFLKNHNDKEISKFGEDLDLLRRRRIKADYRAEKSISEELAKNTLQVAIKLSS